MAEIDSIAVPLPGVVRIHVCMMDDLNGGNEPSKVDASVMLRLFPI